MRVFACLALTALLTVPAPNLLAQEYDEIVVTARKQSSSQMPGVYLEKQGDFLLLEVTIENDSRELSERLTELLATLKNFESAAKSQPDIQLSLVDENSLVRPLTQDSFRSGITGGPRPDTSRATLKVKTDIPENVSDSYLLATRLASFVDGIDEVGRSKIITYDDVAVSIINPSQYRRDLMMKITSDIRLTTEALGTDYRVILQGMSKDVQWVRSGDLKLAIYMPYDYVILPTSITTLPPLDY